MATFKKHRILIYDEGEKEFDMDSDDFSELLTKLNEQITIPTVPCVLLDWHNVLDVNSEEGNPSVQKVRLDQVRSMGHHPIVMSWVGSKGGDENDKLKSLIVDIESGLLDEHTVIIWQCSMSDVKCGGKQLVAQTLGCTIQVDDKFDHLENVKDITFTHFRVGYTEVDQTDVGEHVEKSKEFVNLLQDKCKDWDTICRDLSKEDRNKYKKCRKMHMKLDELRLTGQLKIINSWDDFIEFLNLCDA